MKNVFVAIGGSGTKVAEALVQLLAIGFPTTLDGRHYGSAGATLEIWRVDPDSTSGASKSLNKRLDDYKKLQAALTDADESDTASSGWAMDIKSKVRYLNPVLTVSGSDGVKKDNTLQGLLGPRDAELQDLLTLFYRKNELEVGINRGLYQRPLIGAAVMALFADWLDSGNTPLRDAERIPTNFFLCGSLHGGTGASGVPVMGRFLSKQKSDEGGWRVGACLLAPYFEPPDPPFKQLPEGEQPDKSMITRLVKEHGDKPAFKNLNETEKDELVKQILLGFYADRENLDRRAAQALAYYKDHGSSYFDELYLVGKDLPDKLNEAQWSNGGSQQDNPLNSAEVVAALAALNFFSQGRGIDNALEMPAYIIASSAETIEAEGLRLRNLPKYHIAERKMIDPEKALLSTAMLHHLLVHQIPWSATAKEWADTFRLRAVYKNNEGKKDEHYEKYKTAAGILAKLLADLVDPSLTLGWHTEELGEVQRFLAEEKDKVAEIEEKLKWKWQRRNEPQGSNSLGKSSVRLTTTDFASWGPKGDQFTRGEYLRSIWSELYNRCE